MPAAAGRPAAAWLVGTMYVAAHAWLVLAYGVTVSATGALLPSVRQFRATWAGRWPLVAALAALVAIEHAPAGLWRVLAAILRAC
jgi:hypothetical protein